MSRAIDTAFIIQQRDKFSEEDWNRRIDLVIQSILAECYEPPEMYPENVKNYIREENNNLHLVALVIQELKYEKYAE